MNQKDGVTFVLSWEFLLKGLEKKLLVKFYTFQIERQAYSLFKQYFLYLSNCSYLGFFFGQNSEFCLVLHIPRINKSVVFSDCVNIHLNTCAKSTCMGNRVSLEGKSDNILKI